MNFFSKYEENSDEEELLSIGELRSKTNLQKDDNFFLDDKLKINDFSKIQKYSSSTSDDSEDYIETDPKIIELNLQLLKGACEGNIDVVMNSRKKGAQINCRDEKSGETALHLSVWYGYVDIIQFLLEEEIDVDCVDNDNATPLHFASYCGHLDILLLLLERKANIQHVDIDNATCLHKACYGNKIRECITTLLEVDENLKFAIDNSGLTPLHTAAFSNNPAAIKILLSSQYQANQETIDFEGLNPFLMSGRSGSLECIKLLSNNKQVLKSFDYSGFNVLHHAVISGDVECVQWIIEKIDLDFNQLTNNEQTALHLSCLKGSKEITSLLLNVGINRGIKDRRNKTALQLAKNTELKELFDKIEDKYVEKNDLNCNLL